MVAVSCFDLRTDPVDILGTSGANAMVIRNVGGRVAPVLPHLATFDALFDVPRVFVLHVSIVQWELHPIFGNLTQFICK